MFCLLFFFFWKWWTGLYDTLQCFFADWGEGRKEKANSSSVFSCKSEDWMAVKYNKVCSLPPECVCVWIQSICGGHRTWHLVVARDSRVRLVRKTSVWTRFFLIGWLGSLNAAAPLPKRFWQKLEGPRRIGIQHKGKKTSTVSNLDKLAGKDPREEVVIFPRRTHTRLGGSRLSDNKKAEGNPCNSVLQREWQSDHLLSTTSYFRCF